MNVSSRLFEELFSFYFLLENVDVFLLIPGPGYAAGPEWLTERLSMVNDGRLILEHKEGSIFGALGV